MAVIILAIVHRLLFGTWWPEVSGSSMAWLAASGIIGLGIGDQLLFQALLDVGSRVSTLLMTLAPPATAILAWPILDEALGIVAVLGMAITLGGIAWVVSEGEVTEKKRHPRRGVLFAAGGGLAQAAGLILAKLGLVGVESLDPWSATLIRLVFGTATAFVLLAVIQACRPRRQKAEEDDGRGVLLVATGLILVGAIFGPVLGVWLSLVGIDNLETGIAATLMSLSPVFILPFAAWVERDRITWRAVAGAIISVVGVAVLTLGLSRGGTGASADPDAVPVRQESSTSVLPGSTS